MKIGNLEIRGDLVLAPMAGVTDLAFRTICAELGAAVTVTEMVSSRALIYQDKKSRSLLHRTPIGVCGAQIFGNDPSVMAEGAALALEASGADFIDINMKHDDSNSCLANTSFHGLLKCGIAYFLV